MQLSGKIQVYLTPKPLLFLFYYVVFYKKVRAGRRGGRELGESWFYCCGYR